MGYIKQYHSDVTSPQTTTSATLVDVTDSEITTVRLVKPGTISAVFIAECASNTGAASRIGVAVSINSIDGEIIRRDIGASSSLGSVVAEHVEMGLAAGVYTVVGRFLDDGASADPKINVASLNVLATPSS